MAVTDADMVEFRPVQADDAGELVELLPSLSAAGVVSGVTDDSNQLGIVGIFGGRVVCFGRLVFGQQPGVADLDELVLRSGFEGRGIAELLVWVLGRDAAERGVVSLRVSEARARSQGSLLGDQEFLKGRGFDREAEGAFVLLLYPPHGIPLPPFTQGPG